jgi:prepilin-type N-terminal cleavage/methylation domain-containing protein
MSKLSKGFTLIEMLIVAAIIGILVAVAYPHLTGKQINKPTVQNLDTISYCAAGYRFTRTRGEQMIGADGKPLLCN